METVGLLLLAYLAVGAACCAHPVGQAEQDDFTWRGQWMVFVESLPAVLTWPQRLWRLL